MNIDFPYHVDNQGRTAAAGDEKHIRDLIEQVLFTSPGERINRPTFGSGLLQIVFQPNGSELAAAVQFTVQSALQQWLGDLIRVEAVEVVSEDGALSVTVRYIVLLDQQRRVEQFTRGAAQT